MFVPFCVFLENETGGWDEGDGSTGGAMRTAAWRACAGGGGEAVGGRRRRRAGGGALASPYALGSSDLRDCVQVFVCV